MKITEAYTVYNNGIQSVEPQLAEAIDRIIDAKNKEVDRYKECYEICERGMHRAHDLYKDSQEKLGKVELAEAKARFELEQMNNTSIFRALAEIDRLQTALEFYAKESTYWYIENPSGKLLKDSRINKDLGSLARRALAGDSNAI